MQININALNYYNYKTAEDKIFYKRGFIGVTLMLSLSFYCF